jgi:molecular chaperone GrpE
LNFVASRKDHSEQEQTKSKNAPIEFPGREAELPAATAAAAAASASESVQSEQVQKLTAEKQDLTNTLVRLQADFDNYRKRIEKERGQERHRGIELVVENLLPVLDGFDRALVADDDPGYAEYRKGFELIRRQLWDALAKQGVQRIESVGKEFDPNVHHAIEQLASSEHAEGTVIEELQPGYSFHGRVLRPAMVRVSAGRSN